MISIKTMEYMYMCNKSLDLHKAKTVQFYIPVHIVYQNIERLRLSKSKERYIFLAKNNNIYKRKALYRMQLVQKRSGHSKESVFTLRRK